MKKVTLTKTQDVRRLLSRIINEVHNEEIEVNRANCIGQLCNIMLRAIEKNDIEKRIDDLIEHQQEFENKLGHYIS